jgi:hypothetical protein
MGKVEKNVLLFENTFSLGERKTNANFWIIPDPGTLEKIATTEKMND